MYASKVAISRAKKLRRNQTEAEKILWSLLRNNQLNYKFRRQHPIDPYIVDFFCVELSLIIELDGGQHTEEADGKRSLYLEEQGFRMLRFWNNEVLKNREGVYQSICMTVAELSPHPSPLPAGEGGKLE